MVYIILSTLSNFLVMAKAFGPQVLRFERLREKICEYLLKGVKGIINPMVYGVSFQGVIREIVNMSRRLNRAAQTSPIFNDKRIRTGIQIIPL